MTVDPNIQHPTPNIHHPMVAQIMGRMGRMGRMAVMGKAVMLDVRVHCQH